MKTRIAPTPSGLLHAGNGASFLLAWKLAREAGGRVLLRIDDLDAERASPAYVQDIFDTLHGLGIEWEEGPRNLRELELTWSQHRRMDAYQALLEALRASGRLYACNCSRKEVAERAGTQVYDGHCRNRKLGLDTPEVAWRLRLPAGITVRMHTWPDGNVEECVLDAPDPVVRQRNGRPAYHVASLADDLHFSVDAIVRGVDLLPSTLVQLYMAQLLDRPAFLQVRFLHHPMVVGRGGEKLSKSAGAISLRHWRDSGRTAQEVHALAEQLLRAYTEGRGKAVLLP